MGLKFVLPIGQRVLNLLLAPCVFTKYHVVMSFC